MEQENNIFSSGVKVRCGYSVTFFMEMYCLICYREVNREFGQKRQFYHWLSFQSESKVEAGQAEYHKSL